MVYSKKKKKACEPFEKQSKTQQNPKLDFPNPSPTCTYLFLYRVMRCSEVLVLSTIDCPCD